MAGILKKMKDYFFDEPDDGGFDDELTAVEEIDVPDFEKDPPKNSKSKVVPMPTPANPATMQQQQERQAALAQQQPMKMVVYQPLSYEDAQNIVDNLKARKPVIVNIVDLERECSQRVIDFIAGSVYALNGSIRKVSFGIFIIAPSNVTLVGNVDESKKD